jgi:hypothetical protein
VTPRKKASKFIPHCGGIKNIVESLFALIQDLGTSSSCSVTARFIIEDCIPTSGFELLEHL